MSAHRFGLTEFQTATAFLAPYLVGGFFSNVIYTTYVLRKNKTFSRFVAPGSLKCLLWTIFMAALFLVGTISDAFAVGLLGSFGAVITWGVSGGGDDRLLYAYGTSPLVNGTANPPAR